MKKLAKLSAESYNDFTNIISHLPETISAALVKTWQDIYQERGGFDTRLKGFQFKGAPKKDIAAAIEVLEAADQPCPSHIAAAAITALRLRTHARKEHADDLKALVTLYIDDASDYPADVVVNGCKKWAENSKWFPAWAELKIVLDEAAFERRAILKALEEWNKKN